MVKNVMYYLVIATLSGCAQINHWEPSLSYHTKDQQQEHLDRNECAALSGQTTPGMGQQMLKGAAVGGVVGGATGAISGAILGDPLVGAAAGGAIGAMGGSIYKGYQANEQYKKTYQACLRGRGYRISVIE